MYLMLLIMFFCFQEAKMYAPINRFEVVGKKYPVHPMPSEQVVLTQFQQLQQEYGLKYGSLNRIDHAYCVEETQELRAIIKKNLSHIMSMKDQINFLYDAFTHYYQNKKRTLPRDHKLHDVYQEMLALTRVLNKCVNF